MYNSIESYTKEKDYLIAVDSDGCVFDNMTVKHQEFFFPALVDTFGYTKNIKAMAAYWDEVNLSYPTRGINRFLGLGKFFDKFPPDLSISAYKIWLKTTEVLKNESIEKSIIENQDPLMKKVLKWSRTLNSNIKDHLGHVLSFEGAVASIKKSAKNADIVVLSSANHDAIVREWDSANLLSDVRFIASQDMGSKKECLKKLCEKGYDIDKVIVIGDAVGDYIAAKENFAHYYQIKYQEEVQCWADFKDTYMLSFFEGKYSYDGKEVLELALEYALKVIKSNVDTYYDRFQHVSEAGVYPLEPNKLWTMSFYPGQLYLAYNLSKDQEYLKNKKQILNSFEERYEHGHMETHDIGFLFELTAYYDYLATGSELSENLVIKAADQLMKRYHEIGGYIQAWGPVDLTEGKTRIIIDCMMNLPLLYIASELTGDSRYKDAAKSHATVSSHTLLRSDATTYHTYWMDVQSGEPLYGRTHQGNRDESTWARGQGWSLYGFYKSYEWTKDPLFLEAAIRSADVFIENLPENDICYWDYDFTDENPDIRDSSAASIAAAGLLKLCDVVEESAKDKYKIAGENLLKLLANRYQNMTINPGSGILKEGMYHRDEGARAYTSWGDYYYVEALSTFFNNQLPYEEK